MRTTSLTKHTTMEASIYHTRTDIDHNDDYDAFERARDIRGAFVDFESISMDDLHTVYEFIGEAEGEDLDAIYAAGQENGETRSMMVGDLIITENDEPYVVDRMGFEHLVNLEAELEAQRAEDEAAEAACARAEIAAERRMEKRLARHVDERGWF